MSRFEKAEELGELLGVVSARRHCIGFTFIENDDNSTRHRGLTLRGRTPAYSFAAATVTLFFFYLSYLASSYSRGMTLCSSFAKFSARTLRLLDLPMCVIGQMLARSFRFTCMCSPLFGKLWICLGRLAQKCGAVFAPMTAEISSANRV